MRALLIALLTFAFAFAGCTDPDDSMGDGNGDGNGGSMEEPKTHVVEVSNFQFSPSTLTVKVGDTVEFKFVEGTHTATADNGEFDSGTKSSGTYTWTPDEAGSVPFFCAIHASMTGTITVEA